MARPWEAVSANDLWRGELHEELNALQQSKERIVRIEQKLDELNQADDRVQQLQTIPGVGPRTAEALVAVIDNPHRFRRANQLGSYLGLVPRQFESGQMSRQGRITKQGNALLRTLLVEASWVALRYNARLRSVYQRLTAGNKRRRKIAIVAVARRMLVIAWAMMRDGTAWQESKVSRRSLR
jgi:transposase